MFQRGKLVMAVAAALALLTVVAITGRDSVSASHSWGTYHWARTVNPFTLKLGDNVTGIWDSHLGQTSTDWNTVPADSNGIPNPKVLTTQVVTGRAGSTCKAQTGRIEVCNRKYGYNGWLGLAQIWISGSHITKATAKMNDSYFNLSTYNTPAWRQMVMCQEVAHGYGLGHQDEVFTNANLGSCMDYTNSPASNTKPNEHDFDQLASIYAHLDATTTVAASAPGAAAALGLDISGGEFGRAIGQDGHGRANEYFLELGNGNRLITHVFWIPGEERGRHE